jgi:hypothetical protein
VPHRTINVRKPPASYHHWRGPLGRTLRTSRHERALLRLERGSGSRRAINPGREHYFSPVRVLVGDAAVGLPVVDLHNRVDTGVGEPRPDALLGGTIRQVEDKLITPGRRLRRIPQPDDL